LWLFFGYFWIFFGFNEDFILIWEAARVSFWLRMCGQDVVFCMADDGYSLVVDINEARSMSVLVIVRGLLPAYSALR
jgi:hypothetical protein